MIPNEIRLIKFCIDLPNIYYELQLREIMITFAAVKMITNPTKRLTCTK